MAEVVPGEPVASHFPAPAETAAALRRCRSVSAGSPLPRFLALYGALFCAFGVASPFLPGLLLQNGVPASLLGVILAAGTAIRLLAGPFGGQLSDRSGRPALVLTGLTAAASVVALGYVPARGFLPLLLVSLGHAAILAPINPVADALALGSASGRPGFDYGWVRGAGSAAFIVGTLIAGQLVGPAGLGVIIYLNAGFLAAAALTAWRVPNEVAGADRAADRAGSGSWRSLASIPTFGALMGVAALIGGSHAMHDGFEVIRWRAAGMSASQASLLWALSVAAEVIVFFFLGRKLLDRLGPANCLALSAIAGIVRWGTAASTAAFGIMAIVEPLHGLTFALMHLACMDVIRRTVPASLAATAQAFYGTVAVGASSAAVSLMSGPLYASFGAVAFWAMAGLCACALPLTLAVRGGRSRPAEAAP